MKILVLGSGTAARHPGRSASAHGAAAGPAAQAERTHSAIAVSDDGERWVLLNASSDIGQQLRATPALRPRADGQRPIRAVVLMDAHIDHVAGLLALREGPPLTVVATPAVFEDLTTGLPLLNVLQGYCGVRWQALPVAGECGRSDFVVPGVPGLAFAAFAVPGAAPPYSLHDGLAQPGDHIAVQVEDLRSGLRLFYAPGPVPRTGPVQACMRGADRLLVDGSAWPEAATAAQDPVDARVLIHVQPPMPAPRAGATAQVELAYDGMEIEL